MGNIQRESASCYWTDDSMHATDIDGPRLWATLIKVNLCSKRLASDIRARPIWTHSRFGRWTHCRSWDALAYPHRFSHALISHLTYLDDAYFCRVLENTSQWHTLIGFTVGNCGLSPRWKANSFCSRSCGLRACVPRRCQNSFHASRSAVWRLPKAPYRTRRRKICSVYASADVLRLKTLVGWPCN